MDTEPTTSTTLERQVYTWLKIRLKLWLFSSWPSPAGMAKRRVAKSARAKLNRSVELCRFENIFWLFCHLQMLVVVLMYSFFIITWPAGFYTLTNIKACFKLPDTWQGFQKLQISRKSWIKLWQYKVVRSKSQEADFVPQLGLMT